MNIKYISQYRDVKDDSWKNRSCSVVALYMAISALQKEFNLSVDELLAEAIKIQGYDPVNSWKHQSMAILAHNYGVGAYIEEYKSLPFGIETKYAKSLEIYGINKIYDFLKNKSGLVMASIPKNFNDNGGPHVILLLEAIEENGSRYFIYNDPGKDNEAEGEKLKVSLEDFTNKWRKLAIFLNKI